MSHINCFHFRLALLISALVIWASSAASQAFDRIISSAERLVAVEETLTIPFGEIWRIDPGTRLCFEVGASLNVEGVLVAKGSDEEPIVFNPCKQGKSWGGLRFLDSRSIGNTQSHLKHIVIEGVIKGRVNRDDRVTIGPETSGGGIYVERSSLVIEEAVIRGNVAENGGGIYVGQASDVTVFKTAIFDNTATGSRNVFSGGGGLYVVNAQNVSVQSSVIAFNRFEQGGYPNEEGGGGIYVAKGPFSLAFSAVVGNLSGKGAGMLVLSDSQEPERRFVGNVFFFNQGSLNLEQVAMQTRDSFEALSGIGDWSSNSGQMPFVRHLNRNQLTETYVRGSPSFINALRSTDNQGYISDILDQARPSIIQFVDNGLIERRMCGSAFDFGPVEVCDLAEGSIAEYVSLLGAAFDPSLRLKFSEAFSIASESLSQQDEQRLGLLLADAQQSIGPTPHVRSVDPEIVRLIFGEPSLREEVVQELLERKTSLPKRSYYGPALLAFSLGQYETFNALVADDEILSEALSQAVQSGNADIAASLLRNGTINISKKEKFKLFLSASSRNQVDLLDQLIEAGINPNLTLNGTTPLMNAVLGGHVDSVQLLLRHGADPNLTKMPSNTALNSLTSATLQWFHLGSGWHELAEMLIAVHAPLDLAEMRPLADMSLIRLKSAVELGLLTPKRAAEIVETREEASSTTMAALSQLRNQQVKTRPVVSFVYQLRDKSDAELSVVVADTEADSFQRLAAARILSTRNFELTPSIRTRLLSVAREEFMIHGRPLLEIEKMLRFRSAERLAASKGVERIDAEFTEDDDALPYQRKIALVVGVGDYKNLPSRHQTNLQPGTLTDLDFAGADADEIGRLLQEGRLGADWQIELLTEENATYSAVSDRLDLIKQESVPDDLILFFFSGHGVPNEANREETYFFLHDSNLADLAQTGLSFATLRDWALDLPSKHVLLLIDACRSGTIGSSKGQWGAIDYDALEKHRGFQESGKIALTSSIGEQLSYEWPEKGLGYFTGAISEVLEGNSVNFAASGKFIDVQDLFLAVKSRVQKATAQSTTSQIQIPHYVHLEGDDLLSFPIALNF